MTRLVLCPSTHLVGLPASKALNDLLLSLTELVPLEPSAPHWRQLRLPPHPLGLHIIGLIRIIPFDRTGCLRFVFNPAFGYLNPSLPGFLLLFGSAPMFSWLWLASLVAPPAVGLFSHS